jgi:predicted GNAT family N-acyltransferase
MAEWGIEPLAGNHQRGEFSCGKPPLDVFIRQQAAQYEKKGVGRTYVAVRPGDVRVIGYYTLAAAAVPFEQFPEAVARKLPKHPVPVVLLGRLAVSQAEKGQGLGAGLLIDAFKRAARTAEHVGTFALFVEALDPEAKGFYSRYGFIPLKDQELRLFLPMGSVRATLEAAGVGWK